MPGRRSLRHHVRDPYLVPLFPLCFLLARTGGLSSVTPSQVTPSLRAHLHIERVLPLHPPLGLGALLQFTAHIASRAADSTLEGLPADHLLSLISQGEQERQLPVPCTPRPLAETAQSCKVLSFGFSRCGTGSQ